MLSSNKSSKLKESVEKCSLPNIHEALPQPETCGWNKESDSSFTFNWEFNEVQQSVQNTINFFTRGCSCKKKKDVERRGVAASKVAPSMDPAASVPTARKFCHLLQHYHIVTSVGGVCISSLLIQYGSD